MNADTVLIEKEARDKYSLVVWANGNEKTEKILENIPGVARVVVSMIEKNKFFVFVDHRYDGDDVSFAIYGALNNGGKLYDMVVEKLSKTCYRFVGELGWNKVFSGVDGVKTVYSFQETKSYHVYFDERYDPRIIKFNIFQAFYKYFNGNFRIKDETNV